MGIRGLRGRGRAAVRPARRRGGITTPSPGAGSSSEAIPDAADARGRPFSWFRVAAPLGRIAAASLIASNFAFLFAPLFYLVNRLVNPGASLDPTDPAAVAFAVLSDPIGMFAVGHLLVLIGSILLACAVGLVLLGLRGSPSRVPLDAFLFGGAAFAGLVGWTAATGYAFGRSGGGAGLVTVAATGGWSAGAVSLLAASILYLAFRNRAGVDTGRRRFDSVMWPAFAAVNLAGTGVLASALGGSGEPDLLLFGLALQVILLPLLGIVAYRDLMDTFPAWTRLERTPERAVVAGPPPADAGEPMPLPPGEPMELPPPPLEE